MQVYLHSPNILSWHGDQFKKQSRGVPLPYLMVYILLYYKISVNTFMKYPASNVKNSTILLLSLGQADKHKNSALFCFYMCFPL